MRVFIKWFLTLGIWLVVLMSILTGYFAYDLPTIDRAYEVSRRPMITLLSNKGHTILQMGDLQGSTLYIKDLPKYLPQAVIATEDRRFYNHFGIDALGIFRAVIKNFQAQRIVQGGSTISQQAAKNLFLTPARTFKRKYQELLLALWLEAKFSKDQILSIYLNRVYFGSGAYGIDAAAKKYFGITARKLSVFQAAILAGLLKAPSRINPIANMQSAINRGKTVINNMVSAGYLTQKMARIAMNENIKFAEFNRNTHVGRYFADWILEQLEGYIGPNEGNIIVKTTLDLMLQRRIERLFERYLSHKGKDLNVSQCAAIVMSPNGNIKAMIGGRNYRKSQFNRSTQARRQPGSAFKPIIFLSAMEAGLTPETNVFDSPKKIGDWEPKNYDGKFKGKLSIKDAFAKSVNTIAVKISEKVGRQKVIETARRLGITSQLSDSPSLALGVSGVSLLELTGSYAVLANGGAGNLPYGITAIYDSSGAKLYNRHGSGIGRIVELKHVQQMNDMMKEVILSGTGKLARLDVDAYGKTGTSQDFRDAWFIGYTEKYVAGVWLGNDNEAPMNRVTGGGSPAILWKNIINESLRLSSNSKEKASYYKRATSHKKPFWNKLIEQFFSSE